MWGMLIILNCNAKIRARVGKKKLHFESGVFYLENL